MPFAYIKENKLVLASLHPLPLEDGMTEVEYSQEITEPAWTGKKIIQRVDEDAIAHMNHKSKYEELISTEDITSVSLDGEVFSDEEIGDIIVERVFAGNPHAQMALIARVQAMMISGQTDEALMSKAQTIYASINTIRTYFGLSAL